MKRTAITPISVLLGIIGLLALMAGSDIFNPLVQFIHTGTITPLQGVICIAFTAVGFAACFSLLNLLCGYFVPRISAAERTGKAKQMEGLEQVTS